MTFRLLAVSLFIAAIFLSLITATPVNAAPTIPNWGTLGPYQVRVTNETWNDSARSRDIPVRIYSPIGATGPLPVVIFSHGLGGSVVAGGTWGRHWASWGIVSIHIQHHGSDTPSIISGSGTIIERLKAAMTGDQLVARGQDIAFVVDEIGRRVASGDPALAGVNVDEMGMSGHSFGAQTTLAVAGQRYLGTDQTLKVNKFRAFIAFSPGAQVTTNLDYQFGSIDSPFLSFTGSQDQIPLTPDITPENRELPFENMKRGDKYLCFLDTATHMSFGGQQNARTDFLARLLQMNQSPPDQDHINQVVYTVSTAFWFAYLTPKTADGRAAKAWLKSGGPQSLCNPSDRWQMR